MDFEKILKPIFLQGLSEIIQWYRSDSPSYLRSIFDQVGFRDRDENEEIYYTVPASLSSTMAFPVRTRMEILKVTKEKVLSEINEFYKGLSESYLDSLSSNQLLFLLEKFGCNIPADDTGITSVFDAYKIRGAREVIRANRETLSHNENLLINIDLSGIQNFIYTIASAGALKNLRSRSFFIELLSNHIIYKVLNTFNLHYVNVFMNGGGAVYIISGCPENYKNLLGEFNYGLNKWLLKEFNGTLYSTFVGLKCSDKELEEKFGDLFAKLTDLTFAEKNKKFRTIIEQGQFPFVETKDPRYQACQVCSRDDPGTSYLLSQDAERVRCSLCEKLVRLGNRIPRIRFIYSCENDVGGCLQIENSFYLLSENKKDQKCLWVIFRDDEDFIKDISSSAVPMFARAYTKRNGNLPPNIRKKVEDRIGMLRSRLADTVNKEEKGFLEEEIESLDSESIATLEYIAESAEGAKLIGALRMDADNIGKILHDGFYAKTSLENLSSFSRNLNYFFRLNLLYLCEEPLGGENNKPIFPMKTAIGRNIHVIYSGGDDLFMIGSWSDAIELAVNIGEVFKTYTCNNIDIGLSGGLTLHNDKFPVNKMADESKAALNCAKRNHQPCWMCRKNWISCPLYDVGDCLRKESFAPFFARYMLSRKRGLDQEYKVPKYSQKFTRLKLALKWKRYDPEAKKIIDEIDEYVLKPLKSFKEGYGQLGLGFFHRIKTLLDVWYDEGVLYLPKVIWILEKFKGALQKLKFDQDGDVSLYDLYETYMHFIDTEYDDRFSTLHIPLSWIILQMRGGKSE